MSNEEWTILKVFESEAEARVVESFLTANGLHPQLFGAHTHAYPVVQGKRMGSGLRLVVPANEADRAIELLKEAHAAHSEEELNSQALSTSKNHGKMPRFDLIMIVLLLLLALLIYAATKLQ